MMKSPIRPTTRQAILEAAFAVWNREPRATLADIASAAGVGRATLHRHFKGREDLVRALAVCATEEIEAAADRAAKGARSYGEALRNIMSAMIFLGDRHWFLSRETPDRFPEVQLEMARQKQDFLKVIQGAKKERLFHATCPDEWVGQVYDHLIHAGWEMVRAGEATPAQAADLAWKTLTMGLKKAVWSP